MDLITPDLGLMFWTALVFICLLFVLTKYAWKPILNMVNQRERKIAESLEIAEKTKTEMQELSKQNEALLKEARQNCDTMIKEAKYMSDKMIEDAKNVAKQEAQKIIESAHESIRREKNVAIEELKAQMVSLSIGIAEKVLRESLANNEKQTTLAQQLAKEIHFN